MHTLRPVLKVLAALMPILYCGGLIYYFLNVSGSLKNAETNGLGPTILGLAIVGLLFCIPFLLALVQFIARPRSPRSGSPDAPHDGGGTFDADAVVARYMAQRSAEAGAGSPTAPSAHEGGAPTKRASFGRKIRDSRDS